MGDPLPTCEPLTPEEASILRALKRIEKRWGATDLFLMAGTGLVLCKRGSDRVPCVVESLSRIDSDGGDPWGSPGCIHDEHEFEWEEKGGSDG